MAAISNNALQHPTLLEDIAAVNGNIHKYYGDDLDARVNRVSEFVKQNPILPIRMVAEAAFCAATGAIIGASVAGGIASFIAPPATGIAARLGAAGGGILGTYYGVKEQVMYIQRSRVYEKWKEEAIHKKVYPIFEKYVAENVAERFLCSYTKSLILHPVRDSQGHVFEQSWILADLQRSGGKVKCNENLHEITEDELVYDLNYHSQLLQTLKADFDTRVADPVVVSAVLALRNDIEENRASMVDESLKPLTKQYMDCKDPEDEAEVEKQILFQLKQSKKKFAIQG